MLERGEDRYFNLLAPAFRLVRDIDDTRRKGYGEYYTASSNPLTPGCRPAYLPASARSVSSLLAANDTLFVARCGRSDREVSLQMRQNRNWVAVPNQFCSYVLAPPLVVLPGQRITAPLNLPVEATAGEQEYRIVVAIYTRWHAEQPPDSAASLPALLRTSNSFRVIAK